MRKTLTFFLAALALTGGAAPALARAAPELPPPPARTAADPRFGIALDVGAPAGATLALAFRPTRAFRVFAGPAWNYLSWGVQGGIVLVPWRLAISPALSVEAGHYFGTDLSRFVNDSTGAPAGTEPLLRDVGVTYGAAHLGVEVGAQRGLAFSLRAGLAFVMASASGRSEPSGSDPGGAQVTVRDPRVRATTPSVKLGVQYFF